MSCGSTERRARRSPAKTYQFKTLGVRVDAVQIPEVVAQIERWVDEGQRGKFIAVTGMHGVMEAERDASFRRVLADADLVVPDGMPLVWIGRFHGHDLRRRVYGPELMLECCARTVSKGYRHFFYGGAPGVADQLARALQARFAGLRVAGTYTPPFGPPSEREMRRAVESIDRASPDVLWVGLSTPNQERWMRENRARLRVSVLIGVGAAFDLNSGRARQAPPIMREHGFEWLWRLLQEPRRLWRRYLLYGPRFVWNVSLELSGIRRFD